jgi:hypothetical protein
MEANIVQRKHVAPELFYFFGPQSSLEVIKKKHLYLKTTNAYSVRMLASQIWKEEWDMKLLPDAMDFHGFELKLKGLQDKDPKTKLSISDVLTQFTSHPFKIKMLDCCFHKEI